MRCREIVKDDGGNEVSDNDKGFQKLKTSLSDNILIAT